MNEEQLKKENEADIHQNIAPETAKLLGQVQKDRVSTHDETAEQNLKGTPQGKAGKKGHGDGNSSQDDNEVYKNSDNAEAKDANRPYEDVITPESYDSSLTEGSKKLPKE
jgi:hypothetical protein